MSQDGSFSEKPNGTWGGKTALLIAAAASVGIAMLPWDLYRMVAWPLMLFSTFAHEMGHGLTALLLGGTFHEFVMTPDGAGMATFSLDAGSGRIALAIVSAGGLVGPAILAAIYFRMARTPQLAKTALAALAGIGALAILLVVRNGFGMMFVGAVSAIALVIASFLPARINQLVVAFLAVQLSICVYTRSDYLFTESAGNGPSDVAQMADALLLPYWFWGSICAVFSACILFWGVRGLLRAST